MVCIKVSHLLLSLLASSTVFLLGSPTIKASSTTWHQGTPKVFHTKGTIWISDYYNPNSSQSGYDSGYERDMIGLDDKYGINVTPTYYNSKKAFVNTGADESADAAVNPHYQSLGNGYYKITSGGTGKDSLYEELHAVDYKMYGSTYLVKVYSPTKIKIWTYNSNAGNGKHDKGVIFHQHAQKDYKKILKLNF